jgi:hypothetical protein
MLKVAKEIKQRKNRCFLIHLRADFAEETNRPKESGIKFSPY